MDKYSLFQALRKAGVRYPFLEDCPCGCDDFFGFGRAKTDRRAVWIAFSSGVGPQVLWYEGDPMSLGRVSVELRDVLARVRDVLGTSDPLNEPAESRVATLRPLPAPGSAAGRRLLDWMAQRPKKTGPAARRYHFQGHELTLSEWSAYTGIERRVLSWRLANGWTVGEALTKPSRRTKPL